ncbi:HNH endonuclease [Halarcobacter anaerophilus]|uniref:HNH endonuclease n=1 Tax=Halarcobacter anaerophilus TaxID=877500 RepID=A0A4Q0XY38_9BACT|nr:HNH endonuclease [Halarcobacter anaerophilus]QDF30300.1 hypothetical protein AANAER_2858 [Halarcobacter anaerophilus]RXJ61209.1 hypothetical protein CRV06_14435 [Halarcobacter anaerophilus]
MKVYEKVYLILQELGGRASEGNIVDKYIEMFPDYDEAYTKTKTSSKSKIRGTINAEIVRNSLHKNIKLDKSKQPYEYYIDMDTIHKYIIVQPIGKTNTIKGFITNNSERWAESREYQKKWLQSLHSTVLFTKDKKVFAKGLITKLAVSDDDEYPLDYYYDLRLVDYIEYDKIIEYSEHKQGIFRHYELLEKEKSDRIFKYINLVEQEVYLDDIGADERFQHTLNDIVAIPSTKPIFAKNPIEQNGRRIFPRNLGYAKAAIERAAYKCEINQDHKSFISNSSQKQYVEAHHFIPLKFQDDFLYSLDVPANIVSLCPNCHRLIHFASFNEKKKILLHLFNKRKDFLQKYKIPITEEELYEIYNS